MRNLQGVVLIGFTSCGKTTVGRILAARLHFDFVDLDDELVGLNRERGGAGRTCREMYRDLGEAAFRALETDALQRLAGRHEVVLATGGGAPMAAENRDLLREMGCVVYLCTRPEVILERMSGPKDLPSFLASAAQPAVALDRLWRERDPVYREVANLTVETKDMAPEDTASRVLRALEEEDYARQFVR